jgi:hypothetical protein
LKELRQAEERHDTFLPTLYFVRTVQPAGVTIKDADLLVGRPPTGA